MADISRQQKHHKKVTRRRRQKRVLNQTTETIIRYNREKIWKTNFYIPHPALSSSSLILKSGQAEKQHKFEGTTSNTQKWLWNRKFFKNIATGELRGKRSTLTGLVSLLMDLTILTRFWGWLSFFFAVELFSAANIRHRAACALVTRQCIHQKVIHKFFVILVTSTSALSCNINLCFNSAGIKKSSMMMVWEGKIW